MSDSYPALNAGWAKQEHSSTEKKTLASNTHELLERDEEVKGSSNRSFGLVFAVVFALVAMAPWVLGSGQLRWWAVGLSTLLVAISFVASGLLNGEVKIVPFESGDERLGFMKGKQLDDIVADGGRCSCGQRDGLHASELLHTKLA